MEQESRKTLHDYENAIYKVMHNGSLISIHVDEKLYDRGWGIHHPKGLEIPEKDMLWIVRQLELAGAFTRGKREDGFKVPQLHTGPIRSDYFDGTLNGYQLAAQSTAIYPGKGTLMGLIYTMLKGGGEMGEQQEKLGKILRDKEGVISEEDRIALAKELGDELWYIAARANELKFTLFEIADMNIQKLKGRQARGTLSGSGDDR